MFECVITDYGVSDTISLICSDLGYPHHRFSMFFIVKFISSADLYDDTLVENVIGYQPWWNAEDLAITFSDRENEILLSLPNKEYLLDDGERKLVFMGGYEYNNNVACKQTSVRLFSYQYLLHIIARLFGNFFSPSLLLVKHSVHSFSNAE